MTPARLAAVFLASGFAGWGIERVFSTSRAPRYSRVFMGKKVPFLPVYAVGGTAVLFVAPALMGSTLLTRALVYCAGLTGLEYAACRLDRRLGGCSWDYAKPVGGCEKPVENGTGCVDWWHSIAWTGLALCAERFVT